MATRESYCSPKNRQPVIASLADGSNTHRDCPPRKILRVEFKPPAHPISKLGNDLLEEILIRLPNPKSTCRCKPVCKRWNSLISDPSFNRRFLSHHQSRNEEPPLLLLSDNPLSSSILSFLPVPDTIRSRFIVWDCFKDLLLCGFRGSWWENNGELLRLFLICNPFTKQWVALPLAPETTNKSYKTTGVKLVCQEFPKANRFHLGDGQVFLYSDYRFRVLVGHKTHSMMESCSELRVFCSRSREWSRRKDHRRLQPDTVSLNGKLYWMCHQKDGTKLESFSPFRQNMRRTTIFFLGWTGIGHLSASHGALYLSAIEYQRVLRVRRWEEGTLTWTTCYETLLKTLIRNSGRKVVGLRIESVLAQHPEKPEVFFLKCYRDQTKREDVVFSCNLGTRKLEFVADQIRYNAFGRWMVFQPKTTCCFSTSIPSYQKLLGMYNGSYDNLVRSRTWI